MQRGWGVVVLMATALLVYLVMPNQLMAPPGGSPSSGRPAVTRATVLSDLAHDDSGRPRMARRAAASPFSPAQAMRRRRSPA